MALVERHTPCHDVIQGTVESDDLVFFQVHRCSHSSILDNDYISPSAAQGPASLPERRMTPQHSRPPSHQCLSRVSQSRILAHIFPVPRKVNNSSIALASVSITLPLPAPALIYTGPRSGTLSLARLSARQPFHSDISTTKTNFLFCKLWFPPKP
ncbi:hypothetical protein GQ44DRAFT_50681 [Phaeosphaeriaceae sp. PMI808]|nr:hypothetical protein GQ44DRAFT_50681 [Phaeosphaeriaceae sp. PMI808]